LYQFFFSFADSIMHFANCNFYRIFHHYYAKTLSKFSVTFCGKEHLVLFRYHLSILQGVLLVHFHKLAATFLCRLHNDGHFCAFALAF